MLTITTPLGTVTHDDLDAAIAMLRASVENGFPVSINFDRQNSSDCTNGIHASGPSGHCDCGV